jgi:hypothetical protein
MQRTKGVLGADFISMKDEVHPMNLLYMGHMYLSTSKFYPKSNGLSHFPEKKEYAI